ncbi:hypothetical protein ACIXN7_05825 [Bacteroides fragilis]
MKNVFLALWLVFVMCFLAGCSKKIYVPVETKVTVKETVRDTIIDVQLEREYIKQVVPDTTSIVETKYAISTAIWHGDSGTMEHMITNKTDTIQVSGKVKESEKVTEKPAPYPVYIDKAVDRPVRMPLRWYEKILVYIGTVALGGGVFWIIAKVNKSKK